jgi:hypothetical protein
MKGLLGLLTFVTFTASGFGQGQFYLNNRIGTEVNARFYLYPREAITGESSIGFPDWSIQLLGGVVGAGLVPLMPATTTFSGPAGTPSAGYVEGVTVSVPGVTVGGTAHVVLRVLGPGGVSLDFGPFTVSGLGGGTTPPPNLPIGTSPFFILPEPRPLIFALVAVLGLMCGRRGRRWPPYGSTRTRSLDQN